MGDVGSIFGMPVVSSVLSTILVPKRQHQEKPWHSGRVYHRRVQKKWNKRYGMFASPAVYMIDARLIGLGGRQTMIAHPDILAALEKQP